MDTIHISQSFFGPREGLCTTREQLLFLDKRGHSARLLPLLFLLCQWDFSYSLRNSSRAALLFGPGINESSISLDSGTGWSWWNKWTLIIQSLQLLLCASSPLVWALVPAPHTQFWMSALIAAADGNLTYLYKFIAWTATVKP